MWEARLLIYCFFCPSLAVDDALIECLELITAFRRRAADRIENTPLLLAILFLWFVPIRVVDARVPFEN